MEGEDEEDCGCDAGKKREKRLLVVVRGRGRVCLEGRGLQEGGADKVDVFPGAAFEGGEVLFIWPCEEEDEERYTTDRAAGVLSADCCCCCVDRGYVALT